MHHVKNAHEQRYGIFSFAIDLISVPISLGLWALGKTIRGCSKVIDTITGS